MAEDVVDVQRIKELVVEGSNAATRVRIDQNADAEALNIDTKATTAHLINIVTPQNTTGHIFQCSNADSLTTGKILNIGSNSSSSSSRRLVSITNDNTSATGTTPLHIVQDALNEAVVIDMGVLDKGFIDFVATADADATSAISTFNTSSTTTDHIQISLNGTTAWIAVSTTDPTA